MPTVAEAWAALLARHARRERIAAILCTLIPAGVALALFLEMTK